MRARLLLFAICLTWRGTTSLVAHEELAPVATPTDRLPLCRGGAHKVGHWVRHVNVSTLSKSFHCCAYEDNDLAHDERLCHNPLWEPKFTMRETNLLTGFDKYPMFSAEHACHCDRDEGRFSVNRREQYYWQPSTCNLLQWNATYFCHLLGSRRVLFVGDSTVAQSFTTLTNMLHSGNSTCGQQIMYGRCNMLVFGLKGGRNLFEWVQIAGLPDIVIVNVAAHLHDVGDMQDIVRRLGAIFPSMRALYTEARRPLSIAWRSSHPGHIGCTHDMEPLQTPASPPDASIDKHGWRLHHPTFDDMAANASKGLNMTILDMSPLALRPDAHPGGGDCLHFCLPGPVDLFPQILLQSLYAREL